MGHTLGFRVLDFSGALLVLGSSLVVIFGHDLKTAVTLTSVTIAVREVTTLLGQVERRPR